MREHWRFTGNNFENFNELLDHAESHFDTEPPPDPTTFHRIFSNRSVNDILHSAHHDVDTALAAVERQLRLVDSSLNVTDLLERGVDVSWRREVERAFSAEDGNFMPAQHDSKGREVDNTWKEWSPVFRRHANKTGTHAENIHFEGGKKYNRTRHSATDSYKQKDRRHLDDVKTPSSFVQNDSFLYIDYNTVFSGGNGKARLRWTNRRFRRQASECLADRRVKGQSLVTAYIPTLTGSVQLPCTLCDTSPREERTARTWFRFERQKDENSNTVWVPVEVKLDNHDNPDENRVYVQPDHSLMITNINKDDKGAYFCHPYNVEDNAKIKMIAFRSDEVNQGSAISMALVLSTYMSSREQTTLDFISFVDTMVLGEPDLVTRSGMGSYPLPKSAMFSVDANVVVFTLWSEWNPCTVCGRIDGERRRKGTCWAKKINVTQKAIPSYFEIVFGIYTGGTPCRSTIFSDVKDIAGRNDEIEIAPCNIECDKSADFLLEKNTNVFSENQDFSKEAAAEPPGERWVTKYTEMVLELKCPGTWNLVIWRTTVSWFNVTGNSTVPLIGIHLAARTRRRVEIDSFQRLNFHRLRLEDAGSYSCSVDRINKAIYHVEVLVETYSPEGLSPWFEYMMYSYLLNIFVFAIMMCVRYLGRFKQKHALRTHLSHRWADPDIGRPEAVVQYLIRLRQEQHMDQFDLAEQSNVNANRSSGNRDRNRNWNWNAGTSRSGLSSDSDEDITIWKRPSMKRLRRVRRSSEYDSDIETGSNSEVESLSAGSSTDTVQGVDSDYRYSSTDSEVNYAF